MVKSEHKCNKKALAFATNPKMTFTTVLMLMVLILIGLYAMTESICVKCNVISKYARSKLASGYRYPQTRKVQISDNGTKTVVAHISNRARSSAKPTSSETHKEFLNMPHPCFKPRRYTGVEDILCMKRPVLLPEYKNPCWMENGHLTCLPYFHLIGTCKSGTSDFFKRLYHHSDIVPNKGIFGKELWYWSWRRFGIDKRHIYKSKLKFKWFTDQFHPEIIQKCVDENGHHPKITGHGDPMDIWCRFYEVDIPQNNPWEEELLWTTPYLVHHVNPNVKLLLMLRDPAERLYSHYFHTSSGFTAESFHNHTVNSIYLWKKCLRNHTVRSCTYSKSLMKKLQVPIYTSFYIVHLREWLKVFPREQIFIFRNEDYTADMKMTLKNVFLYLNVSTPSEDKLKQMEALPPFYATGRKSKAGPMKPETKQMLIELYKPFNEELAVLLDDERFLFRDRSFA